MPKAAFADMWQRLRQGKSWMGLVKNRAKSGKFYWVNAYVTPILNEQRQIIEYQSVRTRPSEHDIAWAEQLYARIRAGKALPWLSRLALEPGLLTLLLSGGALLTLLAAIISGNPLWGRQAHWPCWPRCCTAGACSSGSTGWPALPAKRWAPRFARCSTPGGGTPWRPWSWRFA